MTGILKKACTWLSQSALARRWKRGGHDLFNDAMWTLFAKVAMQASQLATFIIAARVLTSAEFGLFSYVAALVALLVVAAEGGWREFVMKTTHEDDRVDQIATVAMLAGCVASMIGLGGAAALAFQLGMTAEALLVLLFSLWVLITPFGSVLEGVLIAEARLKELSVIRILAEVGATLIAIYGLVQGWNIYALALGKLVSQLVVTGLLLMRLNWRPRIRIKASFFREAFEFSKHITANRVLVLFRSYSGTLVVGSVLGLADAGYYRAAERIVSAFTDLVGEPARQIAWSTLRRVAIATGEPKPATSAQTDAGTEVRTEARTQALGRKATGFLILLMVVSTPIYIGLALMSGTLVNVVLGDSWAPAAILVSLLSLKQILLVPGYVTEPLLSLAGAIRKVPAAILLNSIVSIGLIVVMAPLGVTAAAAGQMLAAIFSILVSGWLQSRYSAVRWQSVIWGSLLPLCGAGAMVVTVVTLGQAGPDSVQAGLGVNLAQALAGALAYTLTLAVIYMISCKLRPQKPTDWSDDIDHVANRV